VGGGKKSPELQSGKHLKKEKSGPERDLSPIVVFGKRRGEKGETGLGNRTCPGNFGLQGGSRHMKEEEVVLLSKGEGRPKGKWGRGPVHCPSSCPATAGAATKQKGLGATSTQIRGKRVGGGGGFSVDGRFARDDGPVRGKRAAERVGGKPQEREDSSPLPLRQKLSLASGGHAQGKKRKKHQKKVTANGLGGTTFV